MAISLYLVKHSPNKIYNVGTSVYVYFGHNEPFYNIIILYFRVSRALNYVSTAVFSKFLL
jgi:hypothetical protein